LDKTSSLNVEDFRIECGQKRQEKLADKYSNIIFAAPLKKGK
jgi:hypothetical protein